MLFYLNLLYSSCKFIDCAKNGNTVSVPRCRNSVLQFPLRGIPSRMQYNILMVQNLGSTLNLVTL